MGKKICFVLTWLESGGLQRNAMILANHFAECGHDVSICCLYSTECFYEFQKPIDAYLFLWQLKSKILIDLWNS